MSEFPPSAASATEVHFNKVKCCMNRAKICGLLVILGLAAGYLAFSSRDDQELAAPKGTLISGVQSPVAPLEISDSLSRSELVTTGSPDRGLEARVVAAESAQAQRRLSVSDWLSDVAKECSIDAVELVRIRESGKDLAETRKIWNELSKEVSAARMEKAAAVARVSAERQKAGRFDVFRPDARLPDADLVRGEYIDFGLEPNPAGGRDLVRVVRIFPGESAAFDSSANAERMARESRVLVMKQLLR